MDKTGDVILFDNTAKNAGIAVAMTRLFNAVSVQKNKPEWSSYFVTMPKPSIRISVGHMSEKFTPKVFGGLMKGALIVYTNFVIFGLYFSVGYQALLYYPMFVETILLL